MAKQRKPTVPRNTPVPVPPPVPPPTPPPTDDELLAAVAAGDKEAMNALIERHFDLVYYFLLRRGLQPVDAEAVAWTAFANLFASAHAYQPQPDSTFLSWLMRIAHNAAEDLRRKTYRHAAQSLDAGAGQFEENRTVREPIAFALHTELAQITEAGLDAAVTPAQRFVLEVEYGLPPTHNVHVSPTSRATQRTRGLENLGEYIARHWYPELLPALEQLPDDERRAVHRRIGEEGMEALSQKRLDNQSDSNTPREQQ